MAKQANWLQGAVIYQIYPRSFRDTTGSGVGDVPGIIEKLDYLAGTANSLGVTAIWLSPIYTSPMADFGYDVSNYTDVDPIFGNLQDVERLITEAHARSLKVILDFVPNHTSDEHPWFIESRASPTNPKRDWYTWRDAGVDGTPPNNWLSVFGGSAWEPDAKTGQYYLHSFHAKQPDLNWDNPEVRAAIQAAMRFWLDRGVDGFRVDAVDWISKDPELRDDPIDEFAIDKHAYDHESLRHVYSRDGPHLFERLNELTQVLESYEDRFMITEVHPETQDKIEGYLQYYQGVNPHLSAPFNFEGIYLPWEAPLFRSFVDKFQAGMKPGYTPIYTVGNHDESRIASRIGAQAARTAALMLLTLPGMAFVYYGEELGMSDVPIPDNQIHDPYAHVKHGRDPERTPMQWDTSPHAGFTTGTPWLPVSPDYLQQNVMVEATEATSSLNLYRWLLRFRNGSEILRQGSYSSIDAGDAVFAYRRWHDGHELVVVLNFSGEPQTVMAADIQGTVLLSTYLDSEGTAVDGHLVLRPHEGLLIQVRDD